MPKTIKITCRTEEIRFHPVRVNTEYSDIGPTKVVVTEHPVTDWAETMRAQMLEMMRKKPEQEKTESLTAREVHDLSMKRLRAHLKD